MCGRNPGAGHHGGPSLLGTIMGRTKVNLGKANWMILGLGLALALATPAAAVMRPMSVADLVAQSEQVVNGRVSASEGRWSADGGSIVTQVVLEVDETYKGELGRQTVVLEYRGGEVGDIGMGVSDQPSLEVNEQVIVFLKSASPRAAMGAKVKSLLASVDAGTTVYRLVGHAQGKYSLAGGTASKSGYATMGNQAGAASSMAQDELIRQIKEEVGNAGR
jgi:hypothetical protein